MLSGLENSLFIKKHIYIDFLKKKNILNVISNFFVFPFVLFVEFLVIYKLSFVFYFLDVNNNFYNKDFNYLIVFWIISLFIIGTSSFFFTFKNYYNQKLLEIIIKKYFFKNLKYFEQYIEQINKTFNYQIKYMLSDNDFLKWESLLNKNDKYSLYLKFILIEKMFDLYPSKNFNFNEYYKKSKYKYEQIDYLY